MAAPQLRETDLGPLEGLTTQEIIEKYPHIKEMFHMENNQRLHTAYLPGLETPSDMAYRVITFILYDVLRGNGFDIRIQHTELL